MCTCKTNGYHCCALLGFESVVAICLTVIILGLLAVVIVQIVTASKRCKEAEKQQKSDCEDTRLAMMLASCCSKCCARRQDGTMHYNGVSMENKIIVACDRCKCPYVNCEQCKYRPATQDGVTDSGQNNGGGGNDQNGDNQDNGAETTPQQPQ